MDCGWGVPSALSGLSLPGPARVPGGRGYRSIWPRPLCQHAHAHSPPGLRAGTVAWGHGRPGEPGFRWP